MSMVEPPPLPLDIHDWIKDIHTFHLSVGDMNAWEAKGKCMITYAI